MTCSAVGLAMEPGAATPGARPDPTASAPAGTGPVPPDGFPVLHALRMRGHADRDTIVEICWLCPEHVDATLADLAAAGLAQQWRDERRGGWRLTTDGRDAHAVAVVADAAPHQPALEQVLCRFVGHDTAFVQICHDWHTRADGTPNGHTDCGYDIAVLDRLLVLERDVAALTDALAGALPRFGRYAPRFTAARNRLSSGDRSALTRPRSGSYQDVWTELHEDLVVTLGRPTRAEDGDPR